MTKNSIVLLCYSAAIGFLSAENYGVTGLLIAPAIVITSNIIGHIFERTN